MIFLVIIVISYLKKNISKYLKYGSWKVSISKFGVFYAKEINMVYKRFWPSRPFRGAMQCKVINIQLWLSDFVYNNECFSHQEYVYSRIRGVILIFAITFNGTIYYNCENLKVTNNFHETTSLNWTEIVTELYLKKI